MTAEIRALAKLIKRNGGRIPRHEQDRALELASRIDAQAENNPMLEVERTYPGVPLPFKPMTGGTKMINCSLDDETAPTFPAPTFTVEGRR